MVIIFTKSGENGSFDKVVIQRDDCDHGSPSDNLGCVQIYDRDKDPGNFQTALFLNTKFSCYNGRCFNFTCSWGTDETSF